MNNFLQQLNFNKLTEVQQKIIKMSSNKNILILSPCGSGKTEAVFNWILNTDRKSIFIQPMRTLATSIYERLNEYNKLLQLKPWSIQHSTKSEDKFLDNKYCVTTIDQVLTGWLGLGTQSFIRGKNVITSNLIFDEVQLFEINKTFQTTLSMLDSIYKDNHNNFIIMTATMPDYLISFLKDRYDMEVIVCEDESIKNRNVTIKTSDILDFTQINNYKNKQIIICNTQEEQVEVYNNILDKNRCIVLNNKLLTTDRIEIEKKVNKYFGKESLENNKILIATQIIEAGLDISSAKVYSMLAPIDNLVQRAGRCARWGGDGEFIVVYNDDVVYDKLIKEKTYDMLKLYNNHSFSWKLQKFLINEILNPFYKRYINNKEIRNNKKKLLHNKRNELIRDIRNVNIIVEDILKINEHSFNKETISIDMYKLKKLAKTNKFYKLVNKKGIIEVEYDDINIGDTILITGNNCVYDDLGFRLEDNEHCEAFEYLNEHQMINKNKYTYKTEKWITHAEKVKRFIEFELDKYKYIEYIKKNKEKIIHYIGLHDVGKLDVAWQEWAGIDKEALAHFPITNKVFRYKNRKHSHISAYILKDYIDNIVFNVILQHHGREIRINTYIHIEEFKLIKNLECLNAYGFTTINTYGENINIYENDILNPIHKNWNLFLLLEGLMMEADIKSLTND